MDYIDYYYSNKIKHKGAEHNRHMTDSMKRAIFFIRRYIELKKTKRLVCATSSLNTKHVYKTTVSIQ